MHISSPRILLVDDEPNVLLTLEAILRQEGYEVDACDEGEKAITAIRERHYDLVLTDLKMPGVDGLAVLGEVRKRSPNTVTVMMTGFASLDSALGAVQLGAYEYLLKPTDVSELKAAVRRALERKRLSEIDTLYRINRTLTSARDRRAIVTEVCDAVTRVLGVANARLLILERASNGDTLPGGFSTDEFSRTLLSNGLLAPLRQNLIITSDAPEGRALEWAAQAGLKSFALLPGIAAERLVCVLCADNGEEPYEFHASALRFLQALASQTAMAIENVSLVAELRCNNEELASANQKLRELDKLKSQFLSVATHELRTPLSVILGYNAMLAESLQERLTEEENETLRESVSACKRLIRLVNSMLDITQIESGKMRMNFAPVDLRTVVNGVVALFHYEASKKKIKLAVDVPRLPRVEMDAERIQQVLINLVGNAMKFTQQGGTIRISAQARPDNGTIEVSVTDTGVGIVPEDQARIFDEFAQIRLQAARRQRDGSGLGLAIAKRIVEAHDGSIKVVSEPGRGSTFTFNIPANARTGASGRSAVSA